MKLAKIFPFVTSEFTECDPENLRSGVKEAYSAAARNPKGKHPFPIGRKFAESIGYPADLLDSIPSVAWESFVGVSNVSIFAEIPQGATVLDVGCGAGLDSIIAAKRVGASGKVIGVDFSHEMIDRAKHAVEEIGIGHQVEFRCAPAEALPFEDNSIDIVLVNGIFNLNPHRDQVFTELSRVVKNGGKVYTAEMIFAEAVKTRKACHLSDWFA